MKKFMSVLAACALMATFTGCMKKSDKSQPKKENKMKSSKKQKAKPAKKTKKATSTKDMKKSY